MAKKLKLRKVRALESRRNHYFRRLNNIYIAADVTRAALENYAKLDNAKDRYQHFEVPSGGKPTARIRRDHADVQRLVHEAIDKGEFQKSLVLAVSVAEDYLFNVLKLVLRAYPDRLTRGVRGGESHRKIEVEEFIARDRNELLEELIRSRVTGALSAKPAEYLGYVRVLLEIDVSEAALKGFVEVKATRDIIVHANGRANKLYLEKAGELARARAGELLAVTPDYFRRSIAAMKTLIGQVHKNLCAKYGHDANVQREALRFLD